MTSQNPLPIPWQLRWSNTKSRYYYFNSETRVSQWTSPASCKLPTGIEKSRTTESETSKVSSKSQELNNKRDKISFQFSKSLKRKDGKQVMHKGDVNEMDKIQSKVAKLPSKKYDLSPKEIATSRLQQLQQSTAVSFPVPERNLSEGVTWVKTDVTTQPTANKSSVFISSASLLNMEARNPMSESKVPIETKRKKKKKKKQKASQIWQRSPCMEKLDANREATTINHGLKRKGSTPTQLAHEEEKEEEMEVEYSEEVLRIFEEIQGVREEMKKSLSQEVTMEVQTIVDSITSGSGSCSDSVNKNLFLILDTNLFLEGKRYILDLKEQMSRQLEHIMFVIPWVIIQEIDRIKDSKRMQKTSEVLDLQERARSAVNIINSWLEKRDPTVIGQNPREAATINQTIYGFTIENNDDKILHCCLQYQEKYSSSQVALLTLDKNLRNKAMVMGINSFSTESLNRLLKKDEKKKECNITQPSSSKKFCFNRPTSANTMHSLPSAVHSCETIHMSPSVISNPICKAAAGHLVPFSCSDANPTSCMRVTCSQPVETVSVSSHASLVPSSLSFNSIITKELPAEVINSISIRSKLSHIIERLENVMLESLSALIEWEMRAAYDDIWEKILNQPKPWNISTVLHSIDKHWVVIFKSFWKNHHRDLIKELISSFTVRPVTIPDVSSLHGYCFQLWKFFSHDMYDSAFKKKYKSLQDAALIKLNEIDKSMQSLTRLNTRDSTDSVKSTEAMPTDVVMASSCSANLSSPPNDGIPSAEPLPCNVLSPSAVTAKLEEELSHVYNCFDVVLKQFVLLRDHVRERLSGSNERPSEQDVIQLCQYICTIHECYTRALSENENSDIYCQLLSTLNNFCQQNNMEVFNISQQALEIFFHDIRFREIVQIGLSQITSLRMAILECWQCFTSQAS